MLVFAPGKLQDAHFHFIERRKADVAAFALQGDPAAVRGNQARHAQTRAGADQADGRVRTGRARAHLVLLLIRQLRQGTRQGREIVDHVQGRETALFAHGADRERPVVVRHAEEIAVDRVGDGDHGMAHGLPAGGGDVRQGQVGLQGGGQARVIGTGQHFDQGDVAGGHFQGETGIGAAHVGQQARSIGEGGSRQYGRRRSAHDFK